MASLAFHFDFISPYAYLGWQKIHELAARHGRTVDVQPVLLAGLLNALGSKGPAEIPNKREYTIKHVTRLAHAAGVPITAPPAHPFNPLLALRVACLPLGEETRRRLIGALYAAVWEEGTGIETPERVAVVLRSVDLDPGLVDLAMAPENKDRLRTNTEALLAAGGFGVPTVIADGELFWGFESFPQLEAFLRGEDPVDPGLVARWRDLPASARRV